MRILIVMDGNLKLVDACARRLSELAYSYGFAKSGGPSGVTWTVFAHKGEHRILVSRPTLVEAYREVLEQRR